MPRDTSLRAYPKNSDLINDVKEQSQARREREAELHAASRQDERDDRGLCRVR
jgi:hypothetical protein